MKRIVFILFVMSIASHAFSQKEWKTYSPDRSLQIVLNRLGGKVTYRVVSGTNTVVLPSALGIETTDGAYTDLSFVRAATRSINEQYTMSTGKRKVNVAKGNETSVVFKNKNNNLLQVDLRAYNDGVAFRYHFPGKKQVTVTSEITEFAIPTTGKVWLENYDIPTNYTPAYEGIYSNGIPIGTNAKDSGGWAMPALFQTNNNWLLLTEANLDRNYFASHIATNCENGVYKLTTPMQSEAKGVGNIQATAVTPFSTPWRVIIVGKKLGTIVESNLVHHLSAPNRIGDASWVKPGRAAWSWWGDHESSTDFEKQKKFIDLAKEMGWEYSLVDANWNVMKGGTIEGLIKYAAEKNIPLWLWYNSGGAHNVVTEQPRDIMSDPVRRKAEMKKLREWGVKGIKVDFFQSDKQEIIQLHLDIIEDAAKEKIMVNFHGATLPRGWSRTYPNVVTTEAVAGAENYGWGKEFAQRAPVHNNILTYTRNVIGPMDYTPVTFSDYECCPHTTSNAHELALSVVFESGVLHFADRAEPYRSQDEKVKSFMRTVPVVWDETKFVQGAPGKETILARRSGNTWYVAGINGEDQAKSYTLNFPFLQNGSYKASFFYDAATSRGIQVDEGNLKKGESHIMQVLPRGGFVMVLSPM